MGAVMIKCPRTGRAISTGMTADRDTFRSSAVFFARAYCSICQANHEWFAREAWVDEPQQRSRNPLAAMHDAVEAVERKSAHWRPSGTPWPGTDGAVAPRGLPCLSVRVLRFG